MKTAYHQFVYSRKKGEIVVFYGYHDRPIKPYGPPVKGVRDSMIHSAAREYDSYHNVKKHR